MPIPAGKHREACIWIFSTFTLHCARAPFASEPRHFPMSADLASIGCITSEIPRYDNWCADTPRENHPPLTRNVNQPNRNAISNRVVLAQTSKTFFIGFLLHFQNRKNTVFLSLIKFPNHSDINTIKAIAINWLFWALQTADYCYSYVF